MKVNHISKLLLGITAALFTLTACNKYVAERNEQIETTLDVVEDGVERARIPDTPMVTDTVIAKNDIWLGSSSIKITEGDPLPSWAEKNDAIVLNLAEGTTLPVLAQEISDLTGIDVRLDDLKAENTLPKDTIAVNYSGKLSGLLNYMSNRFGVWWRYKGGVITFFTKETRVFTIYALPTETSLTADLKGSSMGTSGSSGGGSKDASSTLSTKANIALWSSIEEGVKQVIGKEGNVSFSRPTGTITVTAAPYTMRKVATYVNNWNEKMSRQVAITVKVLGVTVTDENNYGLNLNAIFKTSKIDATYFSPKFLGRAAAAGSAGTLGGTLAMALIDPTSNWQGSNAVIEALSTQGKTSVVTSSTVTTLNNKVAPVQVTTSQNYVAKTTVTSTGSGTDITTENEIDTDTLNYGFTMEILPRILDHGRLVMLFSLNLTELLELTTFTASGGDSTNNNGGGGTNDEDNKSTTVQLPKMQMRGFIQEIAMRSGSTLVLTGFEQVKNITNTGGIGQPRLTIIGGKAYDQHTRDIMVVLITPEVLVSPLSPETRMDNF